MSPSDVSAVEDIVLWCLIFGVPGTVLTWWRRVGSTRHARKVELARIKYGREPGPAAEDSEQDNPFFIPPIPPIPPIPGPAGANRPYPTSASGGPVNWPYTASGGQLSEPDTALPAAVIPSPPGAQPVRGVPGQCRHERIVPVITGDGVLRRWICANFPRCSAKFDASIAMYEPDDEDPPAGG